MKKWIKVVRDDLDKKKGYQLCPICGGDTLEILQDEEHTYQERCIKGCYIYDFDLQKRIR